MCVSVIYVKTEHVWQREKNLPYNYIYAIFVKAQHVWQRDIKKTPIFMS